MAFIPDVLTRNVLGTPSEEMKSTSAGRSWLKSSAKTMFAMLQRVENSMGDESEPFLSLEADSKRTREENIWEKLPQSVRDSVHELLGLEGGSLKDFAEGSACWDVGGEGRGRKTGVVVRTRRRALHTLARATSW